MPSPSEYYAPWVRQDMVTELLRRRDQAIADLRDRLALFADCVCQGCGCARGGVGGCCGDCEVAFAWRNAIRSTGLSAACCVSVGMRALCGRRVMG